MVRYRLVLEYDGTPFVGWQRQANGQSVQGLLEQAVKRFCGEEISAVAAGRTDAGVHALAMIAHIDIKKDVNADVVRDAINFHLKPAPIAVLEASCVDDDFHARFSATRRHYRYLVANRRAPLALEHNRAWRVVPSLDADAMHEAAQHLVGKHDFSTFRASYCQAASPVKTLDVISCRRVDETVEISVSAPSFLHHQVRSITGSLVQVGLGKWSPLKIGEILRGADRKLCGPVAPACGLYFVRADYEV